MVQGPWGKPQLLHICVDLRHFSRIQGVPCSLRGVWCVNPLKPFLSIYAIFKNLSTLLLKRMKIFESPIEPTRRSVYLPDFAIMRGWDGGVGAGSDSN